MEHSNLFRASCVNQTTPLFNHITSIFDFYLNSELAARRRAPIIYYKLNLKNTRKRFNNKKYTVVVTNVEVLNNL